MNETTKKLRRELGIASFERNCRLTQFQGRMVKAYKVPGTSEHGRYCMLHRRMLQVRANN